MGRDRDISVFRVLDSLAKAKFRKHEALGLEWSISSLQLSLTGSL